MAGEEVYVARLGAFIARALGETGGFATDLDTEALGFQMPDAIVTDPGVTAAGTALADAGIQLQTAADELDAAMTSGDQGALIEALLHLIEGLYLYVDAVTELIGSIDTKAQTLPAAERDAVGTFLLLMARKTIDYVVIVLLERNAPRISYLLRLLGLFDFEVVEATGGVGEPRHARKELKLERIKDLISDPAGHLAAVHKWGTAQFDPGDLFKGVLQFFHHEMSVEAGKAGGDAFLRIGPFFWSRDSSVNPPGLMLDYTARVAHDFRHRVELSEKWGIDFESDLSLTGGATLRLHPPFSFSLEPHGSASGEFTFQANRNAGAQPFTIIGGNDLLRLVAQNAGVGVELTVGASTSGAVTIDPGVVARLQGLTLSLGAEGSDNFLASLLASADVRGVFDISLGWKLSEGLVIRAAGGLEIAIPMHQSLGPVTLETLYIILKIRDDGSFALETSAGITGHVGPLSAAVERMGAELTIAFVEGAEADLGPLDFNLRFKPPNGVGLALDAGVVKGGGYLFLDYEKGEYAGALELVFSGFLSLKAIGLISTRMPDGSPGFSLLIIITAEFGTPIQLGFGFTLIGVGGLLGLNRTMKLEELAEGVRTGAVESVMFPTNVIANAPQIISDLKRFFPPLNGVFLIGPMAKLGWGTPTLISASLGIIIEIPPGNIAILGVLKCILPDEEAALLVLQVKFIGAIEPTKKRLWFFASLFGSRVLFITLSGEMGLLIAWGDDANFVLSVGGFHPRFNPPPMPFPVPQRVALSILNESWARIRVEGYFAVTSNTAQFGAHVELYFGVSVFALDGQIGFDALFQFSPFYFIITFSASVSVRVFGVGVFSVNVHGQLEGTSPWHVEGAGSISLLFWDIDIPFSHTWGESADTVLPEIAALPIIKGEFEKRDNWVALPPAGAQLSVSLRKIDATQELVLHPLGTLKISQRAVPLDLSIQKIGNQKISDLDKAVLKVGGALQRKSEVKEPFATAQFRDLDAAAKLSAPGYEKQAAGAVVSVSGAETRTSHSVKRVVLHELIVIDNNFKEALKRFFNFGKFWFDLYLGSNSTAQSVLSKATRDQKVPFADKIKADAPGFVIADMRDNSPWGGAATFASHAKGREVLAEQIKANPGMAGNYHLIPAAEARQAA
jgi:hypothetical protein